MTEKLDVSTKLVEIRTVLKHGVVVRNTLMDKNDTLIF
jgi:hypothetical protein